MQFARDELGGLEPRRLCAAAVASLLPPFTCIFMRTTAWRAAGANIGERSRICGGLHITGSDWQRHLRIGRDVIVSGPLHIDIAAAVSIGNDVRIGHDVMLLTVDHQIGPPHRRCAGTKAAPISIGDGAWLSSRVVVLPGVSIGAGAVVAAGAVLTKDVPENALVGGVPARVIRMLDGEAAQGARGRLENRLR